MSFSVKLWQYFIFFVQTNYLHHRFYNLVAIWFSGHCPTWNIFFHLFKFTDHKSRLRVSTEWFICEEKARNECKDIAVHYYLKFGWGPQCLTSARSRNQQPVILKRSECGPCIVLLSVTQMEHYVWLGKEKCAVLSSVCKSMNGWESNISE